MAALRAAIDPLNPLFYWLFGPIVDHDFRAVVHLSPPRQLQPYA